MRRLLERPSRLIVIKRVNERQPLVEKSLRERGTGFRSDGMMKAAETVKDRLTRRINRGLQVAGRGRRRCSRLGANGNSDRSSNGKVL